MAIPVVDLAEFSGTAEQKRSFVSALGKAYEEVEFRSRRRIYGIADATIEGLYKNTTDFFSLPQTVKRQLRDPGSCGPAGIHLFR